MRQRHRYLLLLLGPVVWACGVGRGPGTAPPMPTVAQTPSPAAVNSSAPAVSPDRRVAELERRLVERDRELAAAQQEMMALRQAGTQGDAAGQPRTEGATRDDATRQQGALRAQLAQEHWRRREVEQQLDQTAAELERAMRTLAAAPEKPVDTPRSAVSETAQATIEEHSRQLAAMRAQLAQEHWRRREVEEDLKQTSAELERAAHQLAGASRGSPADAADASGNSEHLRLALEEANRQVGALKAELSQERQTRVNTEEQLLSLRAEASTNPFESQGDAAAQAVKEQLAELQAALASEQSRREDLARRYDSLQKQVEASANRGGQPAAELSEELASLKAEQQRVLSSVQRELADSRQREQELRQTLAATRSGENGEVTEQLVSLREQNSGLKTRLDEERQFNRDLSNKLKAAMRVTDLIFKMQETAGE